MINNEVRQSLTDVCKALNRHSVKFIIIGGVAVGYHGYRRVSGITVHRPEIKNDLDFWYKPTLDNFLRLVRALKDLEVRAESLDAIVFDPQKTYLKIPQGSFHTDFLPQMVGIDDFDQCRQRSHEELLDGTTLVILSYQDLVLNKLALNRALDDEDIRGLRNARSKETE